MIHNMYERKRMFKSTVVYTKKNLKIKSGQLKEDDVSAEIEKHLDNKDDPYYSLDSNEPISTFLGTVKATTRSMYHIEEATKLLVRKCLLLRFILMVSVLCLLYHQAAYSHLDKSNVFLGS